jgi:Ca-activated chloride channel family protein
MNKKAYLIGAALLLGISIGMVRGQQGTKPNQQGDERIITATNLVTANVIVTDRDGRYVKGLGRDDFQVYDENVKQQIAHFTAESAPFSIGIVCEIHESTPEKTRAMLHALKQFTRGLRDDDDFFFMAFGKQGSVTSEFVPSADQVLDHLAAVKPGGQSSLYDAVYAAVERLRKARNLKKALLIVSDGQDENSRTSYDKLRDRIREFDAQIYAIGIANPATDPFAGYGRWVLEDVTRQTGRRPFLLNTEASMGRAVLAEMARVSGGATYFPEAESQPELAGICTQIALELREQYTIGFYPANIASNMSWHKIRITLGQGNGRRGLSLSYRKGYRAIRL